MNFQVAQAKGPVDILAHSKKLNSSSSSSSDSSTSEEDYFISETMVWTHLF